MNTTPERYARFVKFAEENITEEWHFVSYEFEEVDPNDPESIGSTFDYLESDSAIIALGHPETYHTPRVLEFFEEWMESSQLEVAWEEAYEYRQGYDTPEALLKAAKEEFNTTGNFDPRPLCNALCTWNELIIHEIHGTICYYWEHFENIMNE